MASPLVVPPGAASANVTTGHHAVGGYQPLEQDDDLEARLAPPAPLHNAYLARLGGGRLAKTRVLKGAVMAITI
jgi:hypothetical protein